jgi:uncharacterized protein YjiS (DUF1127 family)
MSLIIHTLHTPLAVALARVLADAIRRSLLRFQQWRAARRTRASLASLDDRTLRDLGFHRSEITSIAANPDDPHRIRLMRSIWSGL